MSKLMVFDFRCGQCGIVEPHLVSSDTQIMPCACGCRDAGRIVSGGNFQLDGLDSGFPGAHAKWSDRHEKAADTYRGPRN